jgi:hypothetical protein
MSLSNYDEGTIHSLDQVEPLFDCPSPTPRVLLVDFNIHRAHCDGWVQRRPLSRLLHDR